MVSGMEKEKLTVLRPFSNLIQVILVTGLWGSQSMATPQCPVLCQCSVDAKYAACQNQNLPQVPPGLPTDTVTLNLNGNLLNTQVLSNSFSKFTGLRMLDLGHNRIKTLTNSALSDLPSLQYLNVTNNIISSIMTNAFSLQDSLETLDLSNNGLQEITRDIMDGLTNLKYLNLSGNEIYHIGNETFRNLTNLRTLDLSHNNLGHLPEQIFNGMWALETLYLQGNHISNNFDTAGLWSMSLQSLLYLDISHNAIGASSVNQSYQQFTMLQDLDISSNNITELHRGMFFLMPQLRVLRLERNPIQKLEDRLFVHAPSLENISLSHCPHLQMVPDKLFTGLSSLRHLNLSNNQQLSYIPKDLFDSLLSMESLDISSNNISSIPRSTFQNNSNLSWLYLGSNPFTCDCEIAWIKTLLDSQSLDETLNPSIERPETVACSYPGNSSHFQLQELDEGVLICEPLQLQSNQTDMYHHIGSSAILSCNIVAKPSPVITWITPRQRTFVYHKYHEDAVKHMLSREDVNPGEKFHMHHPWHGSSSYYSRVPESERLVILNDGTLFIDYVQRHDGGPYRCIAQSPAGNLTFVVTMHLDHSDIQQIKIMSIIIGASSAMAFFIIAMVIWAIRVAARRCVNQRKREAIKKLVDNLDAYKTLQFGRLKEMGANQMGKFRDQYHYQLERMRENYNQQMLRIKDNCAQQMEKIRDNYATQVGRLKDYSSHRIERMRDNYNSQIVRIREYGSLQLERLRDNYKLQQQHLLKILETMNLENCRTVIETDCVRAESMLFDSEVFMEPITEPPCPIPEVDLPSSTQDSASEQDYVTASSNSETTSQTSENQPDVDIDLGDTFQQKEMELLPGFVIDMPLELNPHVTMLMPSPILTLPAFSNKIKPGHSHDSSASDTEKESRPLPAAVPQGGHQRHRKIQRRKPKKEEKTGKARDHPNVMETETLLAGIQARPCHTADLETLHITIPEQSEYASGEPGHAICDPCNLSQHASVDRETNV